jgi:hypothetical protein
VNTRIVAEYVAGVSSVAIGVEVEARHALRRNHFVLSAPVLELVSSPAVPPQSVDEDAIDLAQLEAAYNSATADLLYAQTILQAAMTKLGAVNLYIQKLKT